MHVITEQAKRIADTANELAQTKNAHYDHAVAHATDHGAVALATTKGSVAAAFDHKRPQTCLSQYERAEYAAGAESDDNRSFIFFGFSAVMPVHETFYAVLLFRSFAHPGPGQPCLCFF